MIERSAEAPAHSPLCHGSTRGKRAFRVKRITRGESDRIAPTGTRRSAHMRPHTTRTLALTLVFAALALGQPAGATVTDKGDFFSPNVVAKVNRHLEAVKEKYRKTLAVETFKEIPADRKEEFAKLGKEKFFDQW